MVTYEDNQNIETRVEREERMNGVTLARKGRRGEGRRGQGRGGEGRGGEGRGREGRGREGRGREGRGRDGRGGDEQESYHFNDMPISDSPPPTR